MKMRFENDLTPLWRFAYRSIRTYDQSVQKFNDFFRFDIISGPFYARKNSNWRNCKIQTTNLIGLFYHTT